MNWKVQLCELNYDYREALAVEKVLQSEWLTMGAETSAFEDEFTTYIGHVNKGVFVSSATAGLHLILMALGIKTGDEVIMPALTFVSDANVVRQLGAQPIFADSISIEDFNVCENDILEKLTKRTRAIIIVHFAGFPMELSNLRSICDEKGICLIEDCAHAPGAKITEKYCGNFGHFSFFSFFSNKNLAVGEGGMVFAENNKILNKIRLMRSHGMSSVTLQRHLGRASTYDVICTGLNYRPDEMRAALGRVQLGKLNEGNNRRKELFELYKKCLSFSGVIVPFSMSDQNIEPSFHIMPVILPEKVDRLELVSKLKIIGIQTSIHYPSFKNFSSYKSRLKNLKTPVTDMICERELTLPLHPKMREEQVEFVSSKLLESF